MARSISSPVLAALGARTLVARDFLWIVARNRISGASQPVGFWSDVGDISVPVINPDTLGPVTRSYSGTGTLIAINDIPLVANVQVQSITIQMSQIAEAVQTALRTYDVRQARVEIHRGLFDQSTRSIVDPAVSRFVGFVDKVEIITPSENEEGAATLTCVSHTQEMTRSNPDTRSDVAQRIRSATDDFFVDAGTVGEWEHFWGKSKGKVNTIGSAGSSSGGRQDTSTSPGRDMQDSLFK